MKFSKYASYFHDGSVFGISHIENGIEFFVESAEINKERIFQKDGKNFVFTSDKRLKGKLHLEKIKSIKVNGKIFSGSLKMIYDFSGTIMSLEVDKNRLELQILWENYPKKPEINDFSIIEIEAEKIYWENLPKIYNPH